MGQPALSGDIEAHIQGDVGGQVAVGNYILQIGSVHGGVVNVVAPGQQPRPRPRPTPVSLRPRPFPDLLDREAEVGTATTALRSASPVAFYGAAGLGKTALLRHLAHHRVTARFPDGVVYLSARGRSSDDLLQSLFDAFYECDVPFKPTQAQVRHALREKRAIILLDDVDLGRDEAEVLMDVAPHCGFVLASVTRCLWGEGSAVALRGLPPDDALALVERGLGRPLDDQERPAAQAICAALEGHPLHILQAVALAREEGKTLAEVARRVQAPSPADGLAAEGVAALSEPQRRVLAVLAALGDAPLPADHLAALSGVRDVAPVLKALMARGLVQANSPRYSLTGGVTAYLRRVWDLTPWAERALAHFAAWAERQPVGRLAEVADAMVRVLEWAAGAGRWARVIRLGRAVERALALDGRWDAWATVLQWVLQGARALGDRAAEAWALHQIGTRALCLGDATAARTSLAQALRLREALGDQAGAAVTRHNLSLLPGPPPPPRRPPGRPSSPPSGLPPTLIVGLVSVLFLAAAGAAAWFLWPRTAAPPPTEVTEGPAEETPIPVVDLWLPDGCGYEYQPGSPATVLFQSSVDGVVTIWLDEGEPLFEGEVKGGETYTEEWMVPQEPGEHLLMAVLGDREAVGECRFLVWEYEPEVLFDFVEGADEAAWYSSEWLPFPGDAGDERGFALWQDDALLEDGGQYGRVLETHPQWVSGGQIWGEYEGTAVLDLQAGDQLVVTVGFLSGAEDGDVLFQVWHSPCHPLDPDCFEGRLVVEIRDDYDGQLVRQVVPLDELVGETGWFWLAVHAGDSSARDWAVWAEARVERP